VRNRPFLALALAATVSPFVLPSRSALAQEPTSWLAVGGGGAVQRNHETSSETWTGSLVYSLGVGTSPLGSVVVGGLLRGQTFFGLGTDLGLAIRVSSGGFARGEWGFAIDAGAAWRGWKGGEYGQWPVQVTLTGGAPWGFQLVLGTEITSVAGQTPAQGFFAALEIDLLRLTVMRQGSTEGWWPNPGHAGQHAPPPATTLDDR
jgi:hypothetical protein